MAPKELCFILGRFDTGELHTLKLQLRETSQSKQIPFSHYKGFRVLICNVILVRLIRVTAKIRFSFRVLANASSDQVKESNVIKI